MANRIKHYRTKLNLSQSELAARVGTSQQQIQRFEAGVLAPRIDVATKLAEALKISLPRLFPVSKEPSEGVPIDPDPSLNSIVVKLKSGLEQRFVISSMDKSRLKHSLRSSETEEWSARRQMFCFNSGGDSVVLNLASVVFVRFYFDAPLPALEAQEPEDEDEIFKATFYLNGSPEPLVIDFEPDTVSLQAFSEPQGSKLRESDAQIQAFLFSIDCGFDTFLELSDSDGEEIILNAEGIDLARFPLFLCTPGLIEEGIDEMDEES